MENTRLISVRLTVVLFYLCSLLFSLAAGTPAMASNITNAQYYGVITVSNNGTDTTLVSSNITGMSTTAFINGGYVNAASNNTVIRNSAGADVAFMPGYGTSAWATWVPAISGNSYLSYLFYTNATEGKIRYFPDSSGMSTLDNASFELASNFSITQKGYFNTASGTNKYSVYKSGAFGTWVSAAGSIKSAILAAAWTSPTGHSDPSGNWTNEANAYDDNTVTYAVNANIPASSWGDFLILTHAALNADTIRYWATGSTADITQIDVDVYNGSAWIDVYQGTFTQGAWEEKDLPDILTSVTQARVRLYNNSGGVARDGQLNEFDFQEISESLSVTVAVVPGEHTIVTYADTVNMGITVDGGAATTVALGGASCANTTNNWTFAESAAMPYLEYQAISVGGNLRQYIVWQYATTFTDQSGNGNDATPTFRVDSSDADVYAYLANFQPVSEAKAPGYSLSTAPDFITAAPAITGNFTTAITPTYPMADVIAAVAAASGTPSQLPFTVLGGFVTLAISLTVGWMLRRFGSNALLLKMIVVTGCLGIGIGVRVMDFWMLIFFVILAFTIWQLSTSQQGRA